MFGVYGEKKPNPCFLAYIGRLDERDTFNRKVVVMTESNAERQGWDRFPIW